MFLSSITQEAVQKKQPVNQELYYYIFEHPFLPSTRFSEVARRGGSDALAAIGCTSCLVRTCRQHPSHLDTHQLLYIVVAHPLSPIRLLCLLLFSSYCCVNNYIHPYELREE